MRNVEEVFMDKYELWIEDHNKWKEKVHGFDTKLKNNPIDFQSDDWSDALRGLKQESLVLMKELDRYLEEEERSIFPAAKLYTCGKIGPVSALEQDHLLAKHFYEMFLEQASSAAAYLDRGAAEDALSCLKQVLMIVSEHFRIEEQTVFPSKERIMAELLSSGEPD
ncbi:MAG: hypothetical protein K0Q73_7717 [Paenibacillus sp.]|jgi:hemerythrin-like domain-containing protein|nr:hypothetical protein [Paenibacillus sp.]